MRLVPRRVLVLAGLALWGGTGCVATRPPLEETARRLAEAGSPEARAAVAAQRLHAAGTTPLGDGRVPPLPTDVRTLPPVVAGLVPGQWPVQRLELVTLVAALDGPAAAETIEAARRLVAQRPYTAPRRSVLVALWSGPALAAAGVAAVRAMPIWRDSLRVATLVVGPAAGDTVEGTTPLATGGATGEALVALLLDAVRAVADAPPVADTLAADTLAVRR